MKMRKIIISLIATATFCLTGHAQKAVLRDFVPVCDSLSKLMTERTGIEAVLSLKQIKMRYNNMDFYFTQTLGDYPYYKNDSKWLRKTLKSLLPDKYQKHDVGRIFCKKVEIEQFELNELGKDGLPQNSAHRTENPGRRHFVRRLDEKNYRKGLSGKNIALWQSHGKYYDSARDIWRWQRPCLFQTCEDMMSSAYVLQYLIPMLENAGAYVITPRERDIQKNEIIVDNDSDYCPEGSPIIGGEYKEVGAWEDGGQGFANKKAVYTGTDNPFTMGSSRQCRTIAENGGKEKTITYTPDIPEDGEYAVYISYNSNPQSTTSALYTVSHAGGEDKFVVNQKMGGKTWVYLGTFKFYQGGNNFVKISNRTPHGYKFRSGSIISSDAVRFGGGMGNIARVAADEEELEPVISGYPRYMEGARYALQWYGVDSTYFHQNEGLNDYKDDFMSRGDWVGWLNGGSQDNPETEGKNIPIDLTLGWHSDAGIAAQDSLIGTLAIYTMTSENETVLPNGEERMTSREYAHIVQSQIVNDLRIQADSLWPRRQIWDRGYRESRTPTTPSMLLEMLSHQNFADMKYSLDPKFRFIVSRAVYKGMLKYLSNRYGTEYAVQPLPVRAMSAEFTEEGKISLSWKNRVDILEPTAKAKGYILYTRINDGEFDKGRILKDVQSKDGVNSIILDINPDNLYSFKIVAFNDGGKSFPSEIIAAGRPENANEGKVLVVNNFIRTGSPVFFENGKQAGFVDDFDSGVPYMKDIAYIGKMYDFNRENIWVSDFNPGFGASHNDYAGQIVGGNTFDYTAVHGKAIMEAGWAFTSCSRDSFIEDDEIWKGYWAIDLICGKQVAECKKVGEPASDTHIFPKEIQENLKQFADKGGNILVSGCYIGTDIYNSVFPIAQDSTYRSQSIEFAETVLGYKLLTSKAGATGNLETVRRSSVSFKRSGRMSYYNEINPYSYSVESADGLSPTYKDGHCIIRYADTKTSAGISSDTGMYKTVCLGFPIEALKNKEDIFNIISSTLEFFRPCKAENQK